MSSFKGDQGFRVYYDDLRQNVSSDDDSDETQELRAWRDPYRQRREWVEHNYDECQELYKQFRECGAKLFGDAFYQLGDFGSFIVFVYENTFQWRADLLKAK